jgi:hypothetical protein
MWNRPVSDRIGADAIALQAKAEGAGAALACAYSSSAEFEASIIRAKLDAGVYGPKRRRRYALYASVAAAGLAMLMLMA